jgi:hypothetical protein
LKFIPAAVPGDVREQVHVARGGKWRLDDRAAARGGDGRDRRCDREQRKQELETSASVRHTAHRRVLGPRDFRTCELRAGA